MSNESHTRAFEVILLGFSNLHKYRIFLFILLLVIYFVTISGNLLVIILVATRNSLQSPMYLFLTQLSLSDILLTTDITPITLTCALSKGGVIMSLAGCLTQFYVFGATETLECLILTGMAYDRYVAICRPLRYSSIISYPLFLKVTLVSWVLGFSLILITTIMTSTLDFCGSNVIDHFFCDMDPILELSCSETSAVRFVVFALSVPVMVLPLIITITSYGCIVRDILKISTSLGRGKSFSTCSSHLTVVCMFYGTLIGVYILPRKRLASDIPKVISLLYTEVTPMLNPIIYSLRNKDIKEAAKLPRCL